MGVIFCSIYNSIDLFNFIHSIHQMDSLIHLVNINQQMNDLSCHVLLCCIVLDNIIAVLVRYGSPIQSLFIALHRQRTAQGCIASRPSYPIIRY